jgi:hypothetical protein
MKRSSESIRQYLKTAAMTFALLEISSLSVLSASASEPNQLSDAGNSASTTPDASTQQDSTTVPAAIAPPTSASEVYHAPSSEERTAATSPAATSLSTSSPAATSPSTSSPSTSSPSTSSSSTVAPEVTPAHTPEANHQPESLPPAGASIPATEEIPASNSVEATRQALAARLAAIVERDQPTRAVQFRQNLVAAAIHYAEAGAFDQARQTAQHPALPAEVQAETLAKIDQLERSAQALRQVEPGQTELGRTVAQQDIITRLGAATPRLPASWVLPSYPGQVSTPEQMPSYTGGICMTPDLSNQQRSLSLSPATLIARPENINVSSHKIVLKASQQLSLQQPSTLAGVALDRVAGDSGQKLNREKIASTQQLSQSLYGLKSSLEPSDLNLLEQQPLEQQPLEQQPLEQPLSEQQPLEHQLSDVDNPVASPVVNPLQLNQMVGSALTASLRQIGIELPQMMPTMMPSIAWQSDFHSPDVTTADAPVSKPSWITTNSVAMMLTEPISMSAVQQSPLLLQGFGDASQIATIGGSVSSNPSVETVSTSATECNQMFRSFGSVDRSIALSSSGSVELAFPLPIPAEITSLFGWRVHPITQDRRLHTGVDLGAPMGTPVLAALSGQVVVADAMGGYGLTVVIENRSIPERNLYAHLSRIAVQPGAQVAQGSVIGWVGSTGNSTGPHLHFETQMLTTGGWVAVDPLPTSRSVARGY